MANQDEAAGYAQEALSLAETLQTLNGSLKGDVDTCRDAVGDAPQNVGTVLNSLQDTLIARSNQLAEIADNAQDKVQAADSTERFDETTAALQRLEAVKDANGGGADVLSDALGYATLAHENLRELAGALEVISNQCDGVDVDLLDARNQIEEIIRRLS